MESDASDCHARRVIRTVNAFGSVVKREHRVMNDPHVEQLRYRLQTTETIEYKNAKPIQGTHALFDWRLENNQLTLTMKQHFASAEEAKQAAHDFLRSWELHVNLDEGKKQSRLNTLTPTLLTEIHRRLVRSMRCRHEALWHRSL